MMHLGMHFRREVLRRALVNSLERHGSISLQLCGAVAELMSIKAQSVDIPVIAIAQKVNISQYHFITLFKQSIGMTPHQYVMQQRIERAKRLLQDSRFAISEVSLECGFANQSHFTRLFRKRTGMTPRDYREL